MFDKPKFSGVEIRRAREVIALDARKQEHLDCITRPTRDSFLTKSSLVGILGVVVFFGAGVLWFKFSEASTPFPQLWPDSAAGIVAEPPPTQVRVLPDIVLGPAAPEPMVSASNPADVLARPSSAQIVTRSAHQSMAVPRFVPAVPANDPEIEHKDAALRAIEHKLRYETRLGSGGVNVYRVEINESETTRVRGWPRYRTEGKAGIAYFGRGGFTRTTLSSAGQNQPVRAGSKPATLRG